MMLRWCKSVLAGVFIGAALPAAAADCPIKPPGDLVGSGAPTFGTMLSTPPQVYAEAGEPAGFDVDIAKAVATRLYLKTSFVDLAFPGLFPGLNGDYDKLLAKWHLGEGDIRATSN